ncbi:hypothetical protein QQ045_012264 [Rhodiola kirilowii]
MITSLRSFIRAGALDKVTRSLPICSLFVRSPEWLNYAMKEYQELGLLDGVRICKGAPVVTHLMFADDCMLFLKAKSDSIRWMRDILKRYEAVSGQKINYTKPEAVCSKNMPQEMCRTLEERLQVKIVDAHSSYLGLPIIFSNKKAELFRSIEEKTVKRISDWKHKLLSGAGREVLVKSVLQAIPLYAMFCFKLPNSLCRKLSTKIMAFWWHNAKNRGIHWVKADDIYKEKYIGGLGFKRLELMNLALLAKQGWRMIASPDLLVSKIFKAKYFPNSDIFNATCGSRPSYAWRGIYDAMDILKLGVVWEEEERKYHWKLDGSGALTAKSAYFAAVEIEKWKNSSEGEQSNLKETKSLWHRFWKLKIPNKIKIFGWRLYYDGLPQCKT